MSFAAYQVVIVLLGAAVALHLDLIFGFAGVWIFALSLELGAGQILYASLIQSHGLPPYAALLTAGLAGAALGWIFRILRGDDFLLVTLGLAEGARQFVINGPPSLGGPAGLFAVPSLHGGAPGTLDLAAAAALLVASVLWHRIIGRSPARWLLRAADASPALYRDLGHDLRVQSTVVTVGAAATAAAGAVTAAVSGYAGMPVSARSGAPVTKSSPAPRGAPDAGAGTRILPVRGPRRRGGCRQTGWA